MAVHLVHVLAILAGSQYDQFLYCTPKVPRPLLELLEFLLARLSHPNERSIVAKETVERCSPASISLTPKSYIEDRSLIHAPFLSRPLAHHAQLWFLQCSQKGCSKVDEKIDVWVTGLYLYKELGRPYTTSAQDAMPRKRPYRDMYSSNFVIHNSMTHFVY